MFDWLKKEDEKEMKFDELKQGLPSFPDSPMQRGFSQSAIKDAIGPSIRMEEPSTPEKCTPPQIESDVFVKLDRFHAAKKSIQATKEKLEEITSLLHKIRETTLREEAQITLWEKEILSVKARIKEVSENIFDRVE